MERDKPPQYVTPTSPTGDDIAFALTADGGVFEKKAVLLVRSLRDHYPEAPVLTFLPDGSTVSPDGHDLLEAETTVRTGAFPIDDYPHTAFQRAFTLAAEEFDAEYYAAIDTDCVVLNRLTLPRPDADLYAAPMYMGVWPWQSADGITDDWARIFDHYDVPLPTDEMAAVTDGRSMWPPYYNSGVMVTTDPELPDRFLDLNIDLFRGNLTETDPAIETEQVALALLANDPDVDFAELGIRQNWMMGGFGRTPDDVEVLHYQFFDTLATVRNDRLRRQIESYGATLSPRWSDYFARALSYAVFRGGRVLPPRWQRRFADACQPVFDWNTPER